MTVPGAMAATGEGRRKGQLPFAQALNRSNAPGRKSTAIRVRRSARHPLSLTLRPAVLARNTDTARASTRGSVSPCQRVSPWNGSTKAQLRGQYDWGMKPVAYYDTTSAHFQHQDWLGTERLRTTYNGAVEATITSLPFGDSQATDPAAGSDPYFFASLDYDAETQTDHTQFRQYSSAQGRWMSPDPYSGSYEPSNPQSFNRYAYVLDNPAGFVDPQGLDEYFIQDGCLWYSYTVTWSDNGNHVFDVFQTVVGCGPGYGTVPTADGPSNQQGNGGGTSNPSNKPPAPKLRGGALEFAVAEADEAEAGAATGVIHENDSVSGNSVGQLTEAWLGGEGPLVGIGKITSLNDTSAIQGLFGFVGGGINVGLLAGFQVGIAGGEGWLGVYAEGHWGPVGVGSGTYRSSSCTEGD